MKRNNIIVQMLRQIGYRCPECDGILKVEVQIEGGKVKEVAFFCVNDKCCWSIFDGKGKKVNVE